MDDLVNFEGQNVAESKAAFIEAVEDYIQICQLNGKPPEKTYKGSCNVRISPELHRQAVHQALLEKVSLNEFIEEAIIEKVKNDSGACH